MNINSSKKTVTIGIPAHNEEKNIISLLNSILLQKGNNFEIEKIVVACDGCTDNTAKMVETFSKKYNHIKVIDDGNRIGQAARLNNFYKELTSDLFIAFDADVILGNRHVISELINHFKNTNIGLVGGRVFPLPQKTFIGKIVVAQEYFWSKVVNSINHGDNAHAHTGPISAGSKEFLKSVKRPKHIVANDRFLYFTAIKNGYLFKSAKNAFVYIKVPSTFDDYMKQHTRFIDSSVDIKKYFGSWVDQYYYIPYSIKLQAYWNTFIKYPFYLPFILIMVSLRRILSFMYSDTGNKGLWTQIQSSK
jgi:cellulose synthase/poly-beta-1,6-N-acetylglucosamine synthase-like glycosyltransferase